MTETVSAPAPYSVARLNRWRAVSMPLASLCFRTAVIFALLGFGLGIYMGLAHDFALVPAHAHINLLGWVSFFLYGAFYALVPSAAEGTLPRLHYGFSLLGAIAMTGGIAAIVSGFRDFMPVAIAGSVAVYAALILFAWIVFRARFEPAALRRSPKD